MANVINWFEIPANNFERACKFYSKVLDGPVQEIPSPDGGHKMGFLPGFDPEAGTVGGAVVQGDGFVPSAEGSTVYLNGGEDLSGALGRVESAGGTVIVPKTNIGDHGFIAQFMDTEGNRVALHSMS
jgi:uncharacterized protein